MFNFSAVKRLCESHLGGGLGGQPLVGLAWRSCSNREVPSGIESLTPPRSGRSRREPARLSDTCSGDVAACHDAGLLSTA